MSKIQETLNDRKKTHGSFSNVAIVAQQLKNICCTEELTPIQQEALDMICSKIARIVTGNSAFADHWHDIAGYAILVEEDINATSIL